MGGASPIKIGAGACLLLAQSLEQGAPADAPGSGAREALDPWCGKGAALALE